MYIKPKVMRHNESRLQEACVRWFRLQFREYAYMLLSIPNGVLTTESQIKILKREGMMPGAADLLLLVPRQGYGCLCIEMKTQKGKQQETQKIWQAEAEKCGNKYILVRSFEEFTQEVCSYLGVNYSSDLEWQRQQLKKLYQNDTTDTMQY